MGQKIWVIDGMDRKRALQNDCLDNRPPPEKPAENTGVRADIPHNSPALSFSLSLLLWGSGHLIIREYRSGWIFMSLMFLFYPLIFSITYFRDDVNRFILRSGIPTSIVFGGSVLFLMGGVFLALYNAAHAYYRTARMRFEPFQGTNNEFWPLLASLIIPGWGQFLNGQPRKGLFFLSSGLVGAFSLIVLLSSIYFWPVLEADSSRFILDICLAAAISVIPTTVLMRVVSIYDSYLSCSEPVRKRSVRKRWDYFRERVKTHGVSRVLMPGLKRAATRGLVLAIPVIGGIIYFPAEYYIDWLERFRGEMLSRHLEITSELIRLTVTFITG